jgi:hypothetical protein
MPGPGHSDHPCRRCHRSHSVDSDFNGTGGDDLATYAGGDGIWTVHESSSTDFDPSSGRTSPRRADGPTGWPVTSTATEETTSPSTTPPTAPGGSPGLLARDSRRRTGPVETHGNQRGVENLDPSEIDTHQLPLEVCRFAMSSRPSPLKSPTSCGAQPDAVEKSAHNEVEKPEPVDRLTHQVPFDG